MAKRSLVKNQNNPTDLRQKKPKKVVTEIKDDKILSEETPEVAVGSQNRSSGLQIYWNLASADKEIRLEAATALLEDLCNEKENRKSSVVESNSSEPSELWPNLDYALRRLIKGLESSREV